MAIESKDLVWRGDDLYGPQGGKPLATLVRDSVYLNLWRVHADGWMSDMANLTWAREEAICAALRCLSRGREKCSEASLVSQNGRAATP
jgi:hypothetical protein